MDYLDKFTNMTLFNKSNTTIQNSLFYLYLIIGVSYLNNLYSNKLNQYLNQNKYAQHLLGFIILLVIINLSGVSDFLPAIGYTLITYSLFILTTNMDLYWTLIFLSILLFSYFYKNYSNQEINRIKLDDSLSVQDKKNLTKRYKRFNIYLTISIIVIILFGLFNYLKDKELQFGDDFDTIKMIFN